MHTMKIQHRNIYKLTQGMIFAPSQCWREIQNKHTDTKAITRNYFVPVITLCSILYFPINLLNNPLLQAFGLAIINFASSIISLRLAYWLIREFLCNKLNCHAATAFNLTIYSATVFLLFHSLGAAFGNLFIGQLLTLCSFIFIRTLYNGINTLLDIPTNQKTNTLIIASLAIICFPIIISKLLMIIFRISAINV